MTIESYILIAIGFIISGVLSYFHYFYSVKRPHKIDRFLFVLRFLSFFLLCIIISNPTVDLTKFSDEQPILSVLIDNSSSVAYAKEKTTVQDILASLDNNKALNQKFSIQKYNFGTQLKSLENNTFNEVNTNISKAVEQINALHKNKIAPVLLITDGNQTIGKDYEYIKSRLPIYPIVISDTTQYEDVSISKINVNKYSFLNNSFPVEIILNYKGLTSVILPVTIQNKGKTIFKKMVSFSKKKKSFILNTKLLAKEVGIHKYKVTIGKLKNEKNVSNNNKSFRLEVINEQQKIALLTSITHPDIGVLKKAIESNQKRTLKIINSSEPQINLADFQLVILYQPTLKFSSILEEISTKKINFLMISGSQTDWSIINQKQLGIQKNVISEIEYYAPIFNSNFLPFTQKELNFSNFSPLQDKFGEVVINGNPKMLLYQQINNISTKQPLLAFTAINGHKKGFLLGEGLWKWRAASFLQTASFNDFDQFMSAIFQYLANQQQRERLSVTIKDSYSLNSSVVVNAFFTDENYLFDNRADLEITLTNNKKKQVISVPFTLKNNTYELILENLEAGNYSYEIKEINQNIKKSGKFEITKFEIEQQFTSANHKKLKKLASLSKGKLFYKDQIADLSEFLLKNESYYTIQKEIKIKDQLINWKSLVFIILALLSIEWLIRKYHGKI